MVSIKKKLLQRVKLKHSSFRVCLKVQPRFNVTSGQSSKESYLKNHSNFECQTGILIDSKTNYKLRILRSTVFKQSD